MTIPAGATTPYISRIWIRISIWSGTFNAAKKEAALALGAGGSRRLVHIGVIRALNDSAIPIDCITGISFGGIIGALSSMYLDIDAEEGEERGIAHCPSP